MADTKISDLTSYTTPLAADVLPIVDTANTTTKKVTWTNILTTLAAAVQVFTNKTLDTAGSGNVFKVNGTSITDKTGTGKVVLDTAPTISAPVISSHATIEGVTPTGATGTGKMVFDGTPTLVTPVLGVATATSFAAAPNASLSMLSGTYNTIQSYSPTGGGTATLDLSKGNIHHITMPAGNITIALSNGTAGQCFIIRILQDSGGSRTVTWFTTIKWAGGSAPTLTTTASKGDTVGFEVTGSNTYDGFVVGQNL